MSQETFAGFVEVLEPVECRRLLSTCSHGRIAMADEDGIAVLTVNYAIDGDAIVVATTESSLVGRSAAGTPVSFQIDDVSDPWLDGWSVLIRGRLEQYTGPARPRSCAVPDTLVLRQIRPRTYSGRVVAAPQPW